MIHVVKCKHTYFEQVVTGAKKFEVRNNDRNYQPGDIFIMQEIEDKDRPGVPDVYTGRFIVCKISYMLENFEGLAPGFVAFTINRELNVTRTLGGLK